MPLTLVSPTVFRSLEQELLHSYSFSYTRKALTLLKSLLKLAVEKEWIPYTPIEHLRTVREQRKPVVSLTVEEVARIEAFNPQSLALQKVRRLFLIQCYTGLAYADLWHFERSRDPDGTEWLFVARQKTSTPQFIPLTEKARMLLEPGPLPTISNQKYNFYLRELTALVGIEKRVTTHTGRKTFSQLLFEESVSLDVVAAVMGHRSKQVTEDFYTSMTKKRILRELKKLL